MSGESHRQRFLVAGIGIFALLLLTYFVFNGKNQDPALAAAEIGTVTSVTGSVESRLPRTLEFKPIGAGSKLHSQEVVQTGRGGDVVIALHTGTTLKLWEGTRFAAETDATRADSMIGTILEGKAVVLRAGIPQRFRLFYQGREVPLDRTANSDAREIIAPVKSEPSAGLVITATVADESATASGAAPAAEPIAKNAAEKEPMPSASDVLTNDDIVRQLRGQSGFFQRCYLSYMHRARTEKHDEKQEAPLTGTVTVSFRVQPNGRVNEATLVRSTFKDSVLHRCVMEVIERARFKPFSGDTVPVLEFPISLQ